MLPTIGDLVSIKILNIQRLNMILNKGSFSHQKCGLLLIYMKIGTFSKVNHRSSHHYNYNDNLVKEFYVIQLCVKYFAYNQCSFFIFCIKSNTNIIFFRNELLTTVTRMWYKKMM